ncbi:hypothetical protein HBI56_236860 [Parastagonospora nodorum]|uniref:Uncharacterized protein n=1 Tax=Phaeosphaeria nodorum (strain SN15 / ATCC MYA-4574 / FGSC 10173) TaxID=321614 RepID=A0A7U2F338_PHANO|nr:hypothetical protein HBH56_214510 [Parastagonospora nodorum]QRC97780.1 hypothetical protein JI435_435150 [Parastagonospora nodorum SN15]KAH3923057.1 hypothetical protein HBH54_216180 [Parastagonospora nodorum]KAH3941742.1 hypothetical protein HBH53_195910 [Parastagonospora nodorum]KAH3961046.1 hypothetical protein HBH51_185750 [Parastagonospora nodorum]
MKTKSGRLNLRSILLNVTQNKILCLQILYVNKVNCGKWLMSTRETMRLAEVVAGRLKLRPRFMALSRRKTAPASGVSQADVDKTEACIYQRMSARVDDS